LSASCRARTYDPLIKSQLGDSASDYPATSSDDITSDDSTGRSTENQSAQDAADLAGAVERSNLSPAEKAALLALMQGQRPG